jgi:hypothetical protein
MLRSKAPGISIFGNGQEVTYLLSEGNGQARVYPKLGLIVGGVATKDKPLGRRGCRVACWWCVMVARMVLVLGAGDGEVPMIHSYR